MSGSSAIRPLRNGLHKVYLTDQLMNIVQPALFGRKQISIAVCCFNLACNGNVIEVI